MKKCPYCGKEYPDDATVCIIDTNPLFDPSKPVAKEEPSIVEKLSPQPPKPEPAKKVPYLAYPDYQWSAKDAWKCVGMIFCFGFVIYAFNGCLSSVLPALYRSGHGFVFRALVQYSVELTVAAYFARTETWATFWRAFGLYCRPTHRVWFGIVMALIIRSCGYFMHMHHWGKGVNNEDIVAFRNTIGFESFLFIVPLVVMAPFFEECIYRGFLYKAFRGSYSIAVSMSLIVGWTCLTHWRYYSHSWIAALDLSALTIVQCYIREKSHSLWDCIFCHFAFNGSLLFLSSTWR